MPLNIRKPTMISAGAVAAVGMLMNSGANSMDAKKKMEVTTEAKPVRDGRVFKI